MTNHSGSGGKMSKMAIAALVLSAFLCIPSLH